MSTGSIEIVCTACGQDALVRREPVYEGFKRVGEQFICAACGHVYEDEALVPFKSQKALSVFGDEDRSAAVEVFGDDERLRNCRYCTHYTVNPFTQRCGLHGKRVEATDLCGDFEPGESDGDDA